MECDNVEPINPNPSQWSEPCIVFGQLHDGKSIPERPVSLLLGDLYCLPMSDFVELCSWAMDVGEIVDHSLDSQ